eukprot:11106240-Alexandrium_andersonii.AAC.1
MTPNTRRGARRKAQGTRHEAHQGTCNKTQDTEHGAENTGRKTQDAEHRTQDRGQSTEDTVDGTQD